MAIVAEEVAEEVANEPSEDVIELELADEAEVAEDVNVDMISIFSQVY